MSKEREILDAFNKELRMPQEHVELGRVWRFTITRADGSVEKRAVKGNTLTSSGLNHLAALGTDNTASAFLYLAVGTQTAASSLGSVGGDMGEVSRKLAATATNSNEVMILVATWAGQVDGLTSIDLRTASIINGSDSGDSINLNFINSVATILADSDFLKVQAEVQIGSHNL